VLEVPGAATALAKVALFTDLTPSDLHSLAACLRRRRYARGETVFLRGDPGTSLCIVESGRVKLSLSSAEGREVVVDLFGPDEFFGELALLDPAPRSADAVAVEPSVLLLLQRDEFVRCVEARPSVALRLLTVLTRRLRRDAEQMHDAAFLDVSARLARALLRLAGDEADERGLPTTPRLTQSDLAGVVGTTRETLNKWLTLFEREGLIRREKGRIALLRPDDLRRRAA
jgi:CRP-like cAMP-binding protein